MKPETKNSRRRLPKPDVPVSKLLYKIAKKFQRLPHVLGVEELNGDIGKAPSRNQKSEIQDGGAKPDVPISQLPGKIAVKFQLLSACLLGRKSQLCHRKGSISIPEVRNSIWWLPNRKYMYLSLYTRLKINPNGLPHVFGIGELKNAIGKAPYR
jgi:hypothetical protein